VAMLVRHVSILSRFVLRQGWRPELRLTGKSGHPRLASKRDCRIAH
jgi:hypothetical protein